MPIKRNVDLEMWLQKVYGGGAMNYEMKNPGSSAKGSNPLIPLGAYVPKAQFQRLTRKIVLGPHELLLFLLMTTTTEPGNRQNRFATEPQVQVIESDYFDNAERVNGQLAVLGFVAALGSYIITGQIIPGIF